MISPFASDSLRGASMTSSTGTSRRPLGPTTDALAPAAISAGTLSAAGEPLHRLPPMVARPWICVEPIRLAASTTPGHTALSLGCSLSSAPVTAAPTRKPPASSLIWRVSAMPLMSTSSTGSITSVRICTSRSVPPASTRASPRFRREQCHSLVERIRRLITHVRCSSRGVGGIWIEEKL